MEDQTSPVGSQEVADDLPLFSEPCFEIKIKIPKKFVAEVGSEFVLWRFVKLLRDSPSEELIRLISTQFKDNQNSLFDKIMFSMINHGDKELDKLNELNLDSFILPVAQFNEYWYGDNPVILLFGHVKDDTNEWFGLSFGLKGAAEKDAYIVVMFKTN